MSIKRLDISNIGNLVSVYGNVNDLFILPDLRLVSVDEALWYLLKEKGFELILFYDSSKGLYCRDQESLSLTDTLPEDTNNEPNIPEGFEISGVFDEDFLFEEEAESNVVNIKTQQDANGCFLTNQRDLEAIETISLVTRTNRNKKIAIIFPQYYNDFKFSFGGQGYSYRSRLQAYMTDWVRDPKINSSFFFIFQTPSLQVVIQQIRNHLTETSILEETIESIDGEEGIKEFNRIFIGRPSKDELNRIFNRVRLIKVNKSKPFGNIDWNQIDIIIESLRYIKYTSIKRVEQKMLELTDFSIPMIEKEFDIKIDTKDAWEELDDLIGLKRIKQEIRDKIDDILYEEEEGNPLPPLHMAFTGSAGTGKTVVARMVGKIFNTYGILQGRNFNEIEGQNLIAGYVGQTASKTAEILNSSLDGVLFIDEAYGIAQNEQFGKQAITTLLKYLEDPQYKNRLLVIFAGYAKDIDNLFDMNEGFASRVPTKLHFSDYSVNELMEILHFELKDLKLNERVIPILHKVISNYLIKEKKKFGQARGIKKIIIPELRRGYRKKIQNGGKGDKIIRIEDLPEKWRRMIPLEDKLVPKSAWDRLNQDFIGQNKVKRAIEEFITLVKSQKKRDIEGEHKLHMVFTGNPGTGKTEIAKLIGQIFKEEGLLDGGHLVNGSRKDMVAQYTGQTAQLVKAKCKEARGGVLFIDEAYSLASEDSGDSFGKEAVETLLEYMEEQRSDFVVIAAGYEREMESFLNANPGLKSRFNMPPIQFEDYSPEELLEIFKLKSKKRRLKIDDSALEIIDKVIAKLYFKKDRNFGNARTIEQLLQDIERLYAYRNKNNEIEDSTIKLNDIPREYLKGISIKTKEGNDPRSAWEKLNNDFIGQESLKKELRQLINLVKSRKERDLQEGVKLHMVFVGNPGTGKTEIAKRVGQIFKEEGLLPSGHLVSGSRKDLVAGYIGQTALLVREKCKAAKGGVLFIDEAYSLASKGSGNDYGQEAIDTLLEYMVEQKDDFLVIAAGYEKEMGDFLNTNPGLISRFNMPAIKFEDYNPDELWKIFQLNLRKLKLKISKEAETIVKSIITALYEKRDRNFGNARTIEQFIQDIEQLFASRTYQKENTSLTILPVDVPEHYLRLIKTTSSKPEVKPKIELNLSLNFNSNNLIIPDELSSKVGRIQVSNGTGSGFFISPFGHFITCHHVIDGGSQLSIEPEGLNDSFSVDTILFSNKELDGALLKCNLTTQSFLEICHPDDSLKVDQRVAILGYPLGGGLKFHRGRINGFEVNNGIRFFQTDAGAVGGSSGGAVISLEGNTKGKVVGVLRGGIDPSKASSFNFAVDIREFYKFININYHLMVFKDNAHK